MQHTGNQKNVLQIDAATKTGQSHPVKQDFAQVIRFPRTQTSCWAYSRLSFRICFPLLSASDVYYISVLKFKCMYLKPGWPSIILRTS